MKIKIVDADLWINKVFTALTGLEDIEWKEEKQKVVQGIIKKKNRKRRFIPFLKPLPDDHPIDIWNEMGLFETLSSSYSFYEMRAEEKSKKLDTILQSLIDLTRGNVGAVYLTDKEINLIEKYQKICEQHREKQ